MGKLGVEQEVVLTKLTAVLSVPFYGSWWGPPGLKPPHLKAKENHTESCRFRTNGRELTCFPRLRNEQQKPREDWEAGFCKPVYPLMACETPSTFRKALWVPVQPTAVEKIETGQSKENKIFTNWKPHSWRRQSLYSTRSCKDLQISPLESSAV